MIKSSGGGRFQVLSEAGKPLSKKGLSKRQAVKRLQQVEYFKHKKGARKRAIS